jgi:hypothetical protein
MKCEMPVGTTVPEYGRRINRPKRHSAIRRQAGYGLVR